MAGDGYTQFTAGATGPLRTAGLTASFAVSSPATIAFGLRFQGNVAEVREGGVYRADTSFVAGDSFRVAVQSGVVSYSKNGTVFYTSTIAPAYPLVVAASLANMNGVVGGAMISGAPASGSSGSFSPSSSSGSSSSGSSGSGSTSAPVSVAWSGPVNVTASSGSLTKSSGCDGCFDAGAASQQQITGANGYAQFTAGSTGPLRVAGLTQSFSVTNPVTIGFGIRLQGNIAEVREGGVYRKDVTFIAGDVFRISVTGGVVSYSKNGTVFYTSSQGASGPLVFGVGIANLNGAIGSAVLANGL